jgi:uncharacterized membrane protein YbhN (UPF0104 family)
MPLKITGRTGVRAVVVFGIFCAAAFILHHALAAVSYEEFRESVRRIPAWRIAGSLLATAISFAGLAAYDIYAVQTAAPGRATPAQAAFAGTVSNAAANTLGFHLFTGTALRYKIYKTYGLSASQIVNVTGLAGAGIGGGFFCLLTLALLCPTQLGLAGRLLGLGLLSLMGLTVYWLARKNRRLTIRGWTLPFPDARSAAQLMGIGVIEMGAAMMALYILLPSFGPGFANFILLYVGSVLMGIASSAPGGIGVFEAAMLAAFPGGARPALLAALFLYRLIYNILPFCLAAASLLAFGHRRLRNAG